MALFHDLVEIFVGDTVIFDEKKTKTKKQREEKAIDNLEKVLGKEEFIEYRKLIEEYENRETLEAKFVYQLDKVQPIIQIVMQGGASWREYKIERDKLENKNNEIFKVDEFGLKKIIDKYFIKAIKENMFGKNIIN